MLGRLLRMVERHLAEDVVAHVGVSNVVEHMVQYHTIRAIDSAQGTTQEGPLLATEVREVGGGVLQVRDQHQIQICDGQWKQVVECDGAEAEGHRRVDNHTHHGEECGITLYNEPVVLGSEEFCSWREVISILSSILGGAGGIKHQVSWHPSNSEHEKDAPHHGERSLSQISGPVGTGRRGEHFVVLAATSVVVVLTVGNSPRMVRHKQQGVEDGSEEVIPVLALGEGLMTTLVREDPHTRHNASLGVPVHWPEEIVGVLGKRLVSDPSSEVAEDTDLYKVKG